MVAGRAARADLSTAATASPKATPGLRLKEMVTDGSWPRWLTVSGPTPGRELGHGVQGHQLPGGGADVEQGERGRVPLVLRVQLHDDLVLVVGGVDGGDLPGAVGVVERVLDLLRRDARGRRPCPGRSSTLTCGFVICRSLVTSCSPGRPRSFASSRGASRYSSSVSGLCRVNWYWLLVSCPPIRMRGRFCMKTRMPGIAASLGRSSWMISSAPKATLRPGLETDEEAARVPRYVGPPAPDAGHEGLHVRVLARRWPPPAVWCSTIASKEMPWAASVKAKICPVSSLGRNPLGIIDEQEGRRGEEDDGKDQRDAGGAAGPSCRRPVVDARASR